MGIFPGHGQTSFNKGVEGEANRPRASGWSGARRRERRRDSAERSDSVSRSLAGARGGTRRTGRGAHTLQGERAPQQVQRVPRLRAECTESGNLYLCT